MKPDFSSTEGQPAPGPQNDLDRLILKASADPALQGQMFRKLWAANLFTYVPPHPELEGEHEMNVEDGFQWCTYQDEDGPFAAVFTSEKVARYEIRLAGKPAPMIVEMPAEVLLHFFNNGRTHVRIMSGGGGNIRIQPLALASLVSGELRESRGVSGREKQQVTLVPVPDEKVPSKLRQAIRVFCAQRRVPIGVYVFNQVDAATGQLPGNDLRMILWLRSNDTHFYNDFCIMAQRLTPSHLEFFCAIVTSDDAKGVEFLQKYKPLWPILKS